MTELERYKAALEVIATTYPGQSTAGNVARTALEKPEPPTIAQLCGALEKGAPGSSIEFFSDQSGFINGFGGKEIGHFCDLSECLDWLSARRYHEY